MVLRRPLVAALVLGVAMAYSATDHVTLGLVVSTTLVWVPIVGLQMAIALAFIAGPARRATIGIAPALDRFFATHVPWSLYFLLVWTWAPSLMNHPLTPMLVLGFVPLFATIWMIATFFRDVTGLPARQAWRRTLLHQTVTWATVIGLYSAAVAMWPRILEQIS